MSRQNVPNSGLNRPSEATYDDLNGEEVLEILHTRFYNLLHELPELQRRFTVTRAVLRLEIALDIWGATPPKKIYHDKFTINAGLPAVAADFDPAEVHHELTADVDARNNPPDQVREEHGLPLPRAIRNKHGFTETQYVEPDDEPKYKPAPQPIPTDQLPANQPNPNARSFAGTEYANIVPAGRKYVTVVQDYGSLQGKQRDLVMPPAVGGEKVAANSGGGDHAPVQVDFRVNANRTLDPKQIVEDTINKGREIDAELNRQKPLGYERRGRQ